jgi:choline dehydrogenase-like flavoprotein
MIIDDTHYDVIVIGSGAAGGTLAGQLSRSGKRVLVLERGGTMPLADQNVADVDLFARIATTRVSSGSAPMAIPFLPKPSMPLVAIPRSGVVCSSGCGRRSLQVCSCSKAPPHLGS